MNQTPGYRPSRRSNSHSQQFSPYGSQPRASPRNQPQSPSISWPKQLWNSLTSVFSSGHQQPAQTMTQSDAPNVMHREANNQQIVPIGSMRPPLSSGRSFSGLNLNIGNADTSAVVRVLVAKGDWHSVKSVAEAVMTTQQKQHVPPMDPYMLPSPSPSNQQLALPNIPHQQHIAPRMNVSINSSFSGDLDSSGHRRYPSPYSARFPSPASDQHYENRAFRPVMHSSDRIPDHRLEENFPPREISRRHIRRPRRSTRRSYPVANKPPGRDFASIVPSKRTAPPTNEPEHKRVRRNEIQPPEDDMEEEKKGPEVVPASRKRPLDTIEMDVSPIVVAPKIGMFAPDIQPSKKPSNDVKKSEPMKTTPADLGTKQSVLFGKEIKSDLFSSKNDRKEDKFSFVRAFQKNTNKKPKTSFLAETATKDEAMSSPPKKKKRKLDVTTTEATATSIAPTQKSLTFSQDTAISTQTTEKSTQEENPPKDPPAPKKESYMTQLLRKRWVTVEEHYTNLITKIYQDKAPEKVSKVKNLVKKGRDSSLTHDRIHELYEKICNKYGVTPQLAFDGSDPDVMDQGETNEPPKISAPTTSAPFKFGDSGNNSGSGFDFKISKPPVTGDDKETNHDSKTKGTKKTFTLPSFGSLGKKKDDGKLKLGAAFGSKNKSESKPFQFFKNDSKQESKSEKKDTASSLFGSKIPDKNEYSLNKGNRVDFRVGSTPSSQTSTNKPFASDSNPFQPSRNVQASSSIKLNLGSMKSNNSMGSNSNNANRMSISSNKDSQTFGNNNQNKSANPFGASSNASPFARGFSQDSNNQPFNFNNKPTSQTSFNASGGGFNLGKMNTSKKRKTR